MKLLKGSLSIGRTGRSDDKAIRIELNDADSHCTAVLVRMGLPEFAECITGMGHADCEFEFNDSGVIGMLAQSKTEMVPVPSSHPRGDEEWKRKALAPFEVDGWKARAGDITNQHCWSRDESGKEFQRVVFFRHVPKTEGSL